MELFFSLIGGMLFFPLIKLLSMTKSKSGKVFIYLFLGFTIIFTLKSCSSDTKTLSKVTSNLPSGAARQSNGDSSNSNNSSILNLITNSLTNSNSYGLGDGNNITDNGSVIK